MTTTINLLSGPRNVSTALMYSFAQRPDTAVVDEPLYGHYLRHTRAPQPHCEELIEILETDGAKIVRDIILSPPPGKPVYFIKNMAHHLMNLDDSFLEKVTNVFLIRDPVQMLPSLIHQIDSPTPRDAAYVSQANTFQRLKAAGQSPVVIDSRELLLDPEGVLRELCLRTGIPFFPGMLAWEAGPRPEDGAWARWWYRNVHASTGFQPFKEKSEPFPERLRPLLEECLPHYETLRAEAVRP